MPSGMAFTKLLHFLDDLTQYSQQTGIGASLLAQKEEHDVVDHWFNFVRFPVLVVPRHGIILLAGIVSTFSSAEMNGSSFR
jgi:hypothetical protein